MKGWFKEDKSDVVVLLWVCVCIVPKMVNGGLKKCGERVRMWDPQNFEKQKRNIDSKRAC